MKSVPSLATVTPCGRASSHSSGEPPRPAVDATALAREECGAYAPAHSTCGFYKLYRTRCIFVPRSNDARMHPRAGRDRNGSRRGAVSVAACCDVAFKQAVAYSPAATTRILRGLRYGQPNTWFTRSWFTRSWLTRSWLAILGRWQQENLLPGVQALFRVLSCVVSSLARIQHLRKYR